MADGHLSVGWLVAAVATHAALLGAGHLRDESGAVLRAMREAIRAQMALYEIAIEPAPLPPEPEPEPEPPPPPPPTAQRVPPPPDDPYDTPPKQASQPPAPAPMEAPPVLVQEEGPPDPSAVTFVTGQGRGIGFVSAWGTGTRPARRATVPGGGAPPPPPPPRPKAPDRSRPASLQGDRAWDCGFPAEADVAGIMSAVVALKITVRPDGRAQRVEVVSDPGHGFGAQAKRCAKQHRYQPALDREGRPIMASLGPIRIRFTR